MLSFFSKEILKKIDSKVPQFSKKLYEINLLEKYWNFACSKELLIYTRVVGMDKNNSVLKIAVAEQVFAAKLMYLSNDIINKLIKSNKIIFAKLEKINPILILDEIPFSKYQIAGNQNRRKMSYQSSRILLNLAECIKTKKLADSVRKLAKN